MRYIKQLDSLRAIAVPLVIISHWLPKNHPVNAAPNGPFGVTTFFVLSGFLITAILFRQRNAESAPSLTGIKNFYARRALRIFPIYYAAVFLLLVSNSYTGINFHQSFIYHITYTSNFYFFQQGEWDGLVSHFWSLAVEEQFYLIWPWFILYTPRKYLLPLIGVFIIAGVISQYLLHNYTLGFLLPFSCFDAFGLGALLAWITTYKPEQTKRYYNWIVRAGCVAAIALFVNFFFNSSFFPLRTTIAVIALAAISYIIFNQRKLRFAFILNNKALLFLGKISYGLYLYHNIIPQMLTLNVVDKYFNPLLPVAITKNYWGMLFLIENTMLLLVVSSLSYYFFEKRFLRLKKYFPAPEQKSPHPEMQATRQYALAGSEALN